MSLLKQPLGQGNGVKLVVPGLIRAYKTSTAEALEKAGSVEKVAGKWFQVSFGYEAMKRRRTTTRTARSSLTELKI